MLLTVDNSSADPLVVETDCAFPDLRVSVKPRSKAIVWIGIRSAHRIRTIDGIIVRRIRPSVTSAYVSDVDVFLARYGATSKPTSASTPPGEPRSKTPEYICAGGPAAVVVYLDGFPKTRAGKAALAVAIAVLTVKCPDVLRKAGF